MTWTLRAIAVLATLVATGCGDECEAVQGGVGNVELGEFVYTGRCQSCHGPQGQGGSVDVNLQERLAAGLGKCDIVETVRSGKGQMPDFDKSIIDEQDMIDLIEYIYLEIL